MSRTRSTSRSLARSLVRLAAALPLLGALRVSAGEPAGRLGYNHDVRPILAESCFPCHGPDSAARKAGLRLDQRERAIEAKALVPGDPDGSKLVQRIFAGDPDDVMPPAATRKVLSAEAKALLRRWIAEGAAYEPHWSFIPPLKPEPPAVRDTAWVRSLIDRFVLAKLEAAGLAPAPEADRRALARRASLDLTGLPPPPELVEGFVADESPQAYEALVETLLDSPAWGEHRGRHWLDYARYADTHGIHFDNFREMWSYRDWVIRAFNRNLPFDRFTLESLAGDLLPDATLDQRVASGFNRCNMTTNEGGIIDEEYLVIYTRDRTETTAQVWLGLTANCAVCHDHKFDPLPQREFYQLAAFFNNTTQGARDGNIKDTPPILSVPAASDRARWEALAAEIPSAREAVEERRRSARADFEAWLASAAPEAVAASVPSDSLHFHAPLAGGAGAGAQVLVDGAPREVALAASASWRPGPQGPPALAPQGAAFEAGEVGDFERDQPFTCAAWVQLAPNDSSGAICARMDSASAYRGWDLWVQRRQVGVHLVDAWPDRALKVVGKSQVPAERWVHVAVTYDGSGAAAGVKVYHDGEAQPAEVENDRLAGAASTRTGVPFKVGQRHAGDVLSGAALQDLRLYRRALSAGEIAAVAKSSRLAALLARPAAERTEAERDEIYGWWLGAHDSSYRSRAAELTGLEKEEADVRARGTIAHVMKERDEPALAYILARGEYDKRGEAVEPDTPDALPPFPPDAPRNRLGLAQWLLRPDHPLTARVTVNRFWQEVFGTGLVRTSGDFGVAGELPSHPELLDWLAVDFIESGWDVRRFFKEIVLSATYRQAATVTPEKLERDPENRLLSRAPRYRMDAEMLRDHALAASGLLVAKIGGPSVKPYQPPGVWEAIAMNVSNTRSYERDSGESLYRRSLYTFWKRMAPPASMDILNAPNREFCVVRRERTNTPLQALVTLNDEQFVEAARHLAQRGLLEAGPAFDARLGFVSLRLVARPLAAAEAAVARETLDGLLAHYRAHPEDAAKLLAVGESRPDPRLEPPELAAWTMLVNQLMNLDEVLTK
jgi:hypothetical protein